MRARVYLYTDRGTGLDIQSRMASARVEGGDRHGGKRFLTNLDVDREVVIRIPEAEALTPISDFFQNMSSSLRILRSKPRCLEVPGASSGLAYISPRQFPEHRGTVEKWLGLKAGGSDFPMARRRVRISL